jgi:non-ribosomal peptide synthetase component F
MSATGQRSTSSSPPLALDVNFHRQAALTPDRPAVIDDEDTLTYAELELRVLALAEVLRSEFDVGPDVVVGVLLAPSIASVVAYLAILSAGGAFLPIELAYPTAMVDAVCEDAKPAVVLTSVARASAAIGGVAAYAANASTPSYAAAEALGRTELLQRRVAERKYGGGATLDDLAFVVYTSGTTGKPKGILNPHRAPALSYAWRFTIDPIGPGSVVACNVFFIWECLRPLLRGACTYCIPSDVNICKFLFFNANMTGLITHFTPIIY